MTSTHDVHSQCDVAAFAVSELQSMSGPYFGAALLCAFSSILVFVVSSLTSNYSQVDKLWSILPAIYAWFWVCDTRTAVMALVASVWGFRLTYNFYRRGGYTWPPWQGDEDYRWEVLQKGVYFTFLTNPVAWVIFNVLFISLFQNVLLLLLACPSAVAYAVAQLPNECFGDAAWKLTDCFLALLFLFLVGVESLADNQQYAFQTEKYRLKKEGQTLTGDFADGFCQRGLFAWLRKPNYAAEQCIWICFYLMSVAASSMWINWSIAGCFLLVLLFQGSGHLTETITLGKYPTYTEYQARVPLYMPDHRTIRSMWKRKKQ